MNKNQFKRARKKLGLTQAELGQKFGITNQQIWNLENGVTPIKPAFELALKQLALSKSKR